MLRVQLRSQHTDEANNDREHQVDTAVPKVVAAEYQQNDGPQKHQ
jgi:hypothetical protein